MISPSRGIQLTLHIWTSWQISRQSRKPTGSEAKAPSYNSLRTRVCSFLPPGLLFCSGWNWSSIHPGFQLSHHYSRLWIGDRGGCCGDKYSLYMMTSSNGNIFRVTGLLCGEFTGPRWILRSKASDAELSCFLWFFSVQNAFIWFGFVLCVCVCVSFVLRFVVWFWSILSLSFGFTSLTHSNYVIAPVWVKQPLRSFVVLCFLLLCNN